MNYAYEEPGYIKISGAKIKYATERYVFTCPNCGYQMKLGTDGSKYGIIGSFACQECKEIYQASDEACSFSPLIIHSDIFGKIIVKNQTNK